MTDRRDGENSSMSFQPSLTSPCDFVRQEWTAEEYVRRGASRHKVLVGLPTYGQSYKLTSLNRQGLGAAASLGAPGPFTREPGFWAYYEVGVTPEDLGLLGGR